MDAVIKGVKIGKEIIGMRFKEEEERVEIALPLVPSLLCFVL